MGELERVAELQVGRRVVVREPPGELLDLRARGHDVPRRAEDTNEQAPRGYVVGVPGESLLQRRRRLVVVALPHERLRSHGRTRPQAAGAAHDEDADEQQRERDAAEPARTQARTQSANDLVGRPCEPPMIRAPSAARQFGGKAARTCGYVSLARATT